MSKDLLLEIGTEEVPAHVMPGILAQLKENAEKAFQENRIAFGSVRTIGTPRRTALLVKDLADKQKVIYICARLGRVFYGKNTKTTYEKIDKNFWCNRDTLNDYILYY